MPVLERIGSYCRALIKRDYWAKYQEIYERGDFDLKAKKHFLERWFEDSVGYFPNIDHPKTFNEKMQWYKLYYDDPLVAKCIDKVTFKDHIREVLGSEYAIPTLEVCSNPEEIDLGGLPERFVIKANYGSSSKEVIIVRDKSQFDAAAAYRTISKWTKPWWRSAWGGYEFVSPKILIEEYIEQLEGQVNDYKFWCFNGDPKYVTVNAERFTDHRLDFFDLDWRKQDLEYAGFPNSMKKIEPPPNLALMIVLSKRLSEAFPFVRVDFYDLGDRVFVGEMTFYPGGGINRFVPEEWDRRFGEMIKLPDRSVRNNTIQARQ